MNKDVNVDYESDINEISWYDSENIIMNRIDKLESKLYENTKKNKKQHKIFGEVSFYILPYLELLLSNYPYLKFICTVKSRKKTFDDVLNECINENNFLLRILLFRKKYKNHLISHEGKKWQKDYIIDKCYPKFKVETLNEAVFQYIDLYYNKIKMFEKKYPKNLQIFYSDELNSKYGRKKIHNFMDLK
tara:strand:- start:8976 stop:9542 length:567 start_codon:yes stop_codon:yes gene_type:complete